MRRCLMGIDPLSFARWKSLGDWLCNNVTLILQNSTFKNGSFGAR
jgi:hypothetical protein